MTHPRHQVAGARSRTRGECIPGVPQVVKLQMRLPDPRDGRLPVDQLVEVAPPDRAPALGGEHERVRVVVDVGRQVVADDLDDGRRQADPAPAGPRFRRTEDQADPALLGVRLGYSVERSRSVIVALLRPPEPSTTGGRAATLRCPVGSRT